HQFKKMDGRLRQRMVLGCRGLEFLFAHHGARHLRASRIDRQSVGSDRRTIVRHAAHGLAAAISYHNGIGKTYPREPFMKGDKKVIEALNGALTIELTAINQYFCQAKMCKNWGFMKLAAKHYEESMGEMKHAEMLIDRILFLEGVPEIARYDVI